MTYAWIEDGKVRDLSSNPNEQFHPDVAGHYSIQVPDDAQVGDFWDGEVLSKPPQAEQQVQAPAVIVPKVLSPIQFKLLFTSAERIAIKTAKLTDPVLEDAFEILDDPRLTEVDLGLQSNIDLIGYLVALTLITAERAVEIKSGVVK